jgi:hypothetical protein
VKTRATSSPKKSKVVFDFYREGPQQRRAQLRALGKLMRACRPVECCDDRRIAVAKFAQAASIAGTSAGKRSFVFAQGH